MDLRRLLVGIACVSGGLAVVTQLLRLADDVFAAPPVVRMAFLVLWLVGVSLIGFGLLHPFKRGLVGAILAIILQCAFGDLLLNGL
jgi:hypothetical protein